MQSAKLLYESEAFQKAIEAVEGRLTKDLLATTSNEECIKVRDQYRALQSVKSQLREWAQKA